MITKHEALDTLDRLEFFQGQRAGRELWFEKNSQLQDIDIACFVRDISNLREYIQTASVAPRAEVAREIFNDIAKMFFEKQKQYENSHQSGKARQMMVARFEVYKLQKKYTDATDTNVGRKTKENKKGAVTDVPIQLSIFDKEDKND